jgi:hypothetical protein
LPTDQLRPVFLAVSFECADMSALGNDATYRVEKSGVMSPQSRFRLPPGFPIQNPVNGIWTKKQAGRKTGLSKTRRIENLFN